MAEYAYTYSTKKGVVSGATLPWWSPFRDTDGQRIKKAKFQRKLQILDKTGYICTFDRQAGRCIDLKRGLSLTYFGEQDYQ